MQKCLSQTKSKAPKQTSDVTAATAQDAEIVFPTRPRFTLETLRTIRIAPGDGDSTIAAYTHRYNGVSVTKIVEFSDLTHAERDAALLFILRYCRGAEIKRKGKPRGRAVAAKRRGGDRKREKLTESELRELDNLDFGKLYEAAVADMAGFSLPEIEDFSALELADWNSDPTAEPATLADCQTSTDKSESVPHGAQ